jgi:manganese transport protein
MLKIKNPFNFFGFFRDLRRKDHKPVFGALDIFKYIGPGLLVTIGFIDPGNWAANIATGSQFGYTLLWVISLSTIMLIVLQHNVAHLGIATGLCLSEAAMIYLKPWISKSVLSFAVLASVSTSLAEILGGSIALNMLFNIPIKLGAILVTVFVLIMLLTNSYRKIERWIIGFVSVIGLSFLYELFLVKIDWVQAGMAWVTPSFPQGSILLIMSVMGAVVMPHNLFLHSEIIQSRQWNLEDDLVIKRQLKFEFADTLFSMIVGWAINSAMILLAAATFFSSGTHVNEIQQANKLLEPLLGSNATIVFAVALLLAGIASTITSGMAGGSIVSGMYKEPYDIKDNHSRIGVIISLIGALILIFFIGNPFKGLILSQVFLGIQLPFTVAIQVYLTSSEKVMGKYANGRFLTGVLLTITGIVTFLNFKLLIDFIKGL